MKKIGKKFVLSLCFLLSMGMNPYSYAGELSYMEKEISKALIKVGCSDTWCEGIEDFDLHTLECSTDNEQCTLGFKYQYRHNESGELREHTCAIPTVFKKDYFEKHSKFQITKKLLFAIIKCMD